MQYVFVNSNYVIKHELLENPVKVYNFGAWDLHTYYVSAYGVLVHNACGYKKLNPSQFEREYNLPDRTFHETIKPYIIKAAKPNYLVGNNPDIMLDRALNIAYQGAKGRGFQETGLNMLEIIRKLGLIE